MYQNQWLWQIFLLVTLMKMHQTTSTLTYLVSSCSNITMFDSNSPYQTNLNTLFDSLTTNATNNPSGFRTATVSSPDSETIYSMFLCRGDVNSTTCHYCVTTATTIGIPVTYCPNRKVAIIWYDACMVRYSNQSIFNRLDHYFQVPYTSDNSITGNATRFEELVSSLMNEIIVRAAEGGSLKKFASAFVNYTTDQTIYGLAQCTPDLTASDCNQCLSQSIVEFKPTQGNQVMGLDCYIRYEVQPFFDLSSLPPPPPPQPPASEPNSSTPSGSNGKKKVSIKLLIFIIVAALVILAVFFSICMIRKKSRKGFGVLAAEGENYLSAESYDLVTLQSATNYFAEENEVGRGGFGCVYMGTLPTGQLIAVKRLSEGSTQGIPEFKAEVSLVAKLQHRNLVKMLGSCYEDPEKLLVYEYLPNKSLDKHIFDKENRRELHWPRSYTIIKGIARGLMYLHHDSQSRIIHRDLKPGNILLDADMNPKISDFGTSRIFGVDETLNNYTSKEVGTFGYMAPEYLQDGHYSIKLDVYSFGVLVLEIISGIRNNAFNNFGDPKDFLNYAWKCWEEENPINFLYPAIRDSCLDSDEVMRCLHLALLCVQPSVDDRLTMLHLVHKLDSFSDAIPVPERPGFPSRNRI